MADKFTIAVTTLIVLLVALFVFQNYYKAPTVESDQPLENAVQLVNLQLASSWQVPNSSLTFTHNVSIVDGRRADIATFYNPGRANKKVFLLVFVPKKIARNVGEISFSKQLQVVNEDPCGFVELDLPQGTTQFAAAYAALATAPITGGAILVPFASRVNLEELCNALTASTGYIEGLSAEQAASFAQSLAVNPAFLANGGIRQLTAQPTQEEDLIAPVNVKVSELAPRANAEFNLPNLPRGTLVWRIEESGAPGFVSRHLRIFRPDPDNGRISVSVDFSDELNSPPLDLTPTSILSYVVFSDTARPGQTLARVPVNIIVDHFDGIKLAPRRLTRRTGGEFLFLLNNLPYVVSTEVEYGPSKRKTPLDLNPRGGSARVIYVDNDDAAENGLSIFPLPLADIQTIGEGGNIGLEPLFGLPSISEDCSSKFCTCREAQLVLRQSVDKVKSDYQRYNNGQLELENGRFCEGFLFGLASINECNLGVNFEAGSRPVSSSIQVVRICLNPRNQRVSAEVHQYLYAISLVNDVTVEQIEQTAKLPFLCHEPAGLPASHPNELCSQDTRVS